MLIQILTMHPDLEKGMDLERILSHILVQILKTDPELKLDPDQDLDPDLEII
jgi:hypothetical protein